MRLCSVLAWVGLAVAALVVAGAAGGVSGGDGGRCDGVDGLGGRVAVVDGVEDMLGAGLPGAGFALLYAPGCPHSARAWPRFLGAAAAVEAQLGRMRAHCVSGTASTAATVPNTRYVASDASRKPEIALSVRIWAVPLMVAVVNGSVAATRVPPVDDDPTAMAAGMARQLERRWPMLRETQLVELVRGGERGVCPAVVLDRHPECSAAAGAPVELLPPWPEVRIAFRPSRPFTPGTLAASIVVMVAVVVWAASPGTVSLWWRHIFEPPLVVQHLHRE